jgi:hypothetical protein
MPEGLYEEEDEEGVQPPEAMDDEDDMEDDEDDMEEEEDVDVTVDEEQVASLRTAVEVLQSIIDASEGEGGEMDDEMGDPMADAEPAPDTMADAGAPDAPGAMDMPEDEPEMPVAESVERITQRVLKRVTNRLVREALNK